MHPGTIGSAVVFFLQQEGPGFKESSYVVLNVFLVHVQLPPSVRFPGHSQLSFGMSW